LFFFLLNSFSILYYYIYPLYPLVAREKRKKEGRKNGRMEEFGFSFGFGVGFGVGFGSRPHPRPHQNPSSRLWLSPAKVLAQHPVNAKANAKSSLFPVKG
jgi:hypothetical protein